MMTTNGFASSSKVPLIETLMFVYYTKSINKCKQMQTTFKMVGLILSKIMHFKHVQGK